MDLISVPDAAESVGAVDSAQPTGLRSAVTDWLSARQEQGAAGGAEVAVAAALERVTHPPVICVRLRRGVGEQSVRAAFEQCRGELGKGRAGAVTLVIERQPIRRTLADGYCDLTTNQPVEHAFVLAEALRGIGVSPVQAQPPDAIAAAAEPADTEHSVEETDAVEDSVARLKDRALAIELAEIAVAFPAARDSLEELLWRHCV